MKRWKLVVLVIVTYACSHVAAVLAGPLAATYAHDLTFSYSAILVGLLIGAVGIFLTGIVTAAPLVREAVKDPVKAERIVSSIRRSSRELRSDVMVALAMVALQGLIELMRLVDIPFLVWPIHADGFGKTDVLNALAICAAALEFIAVFDCVGAMFSLGALVDEAGSPSITPSKHGRSGNE